MLAIPPALDNCSYLVPSTAARPAVFPRVGSVGRHV